MAVSMEDPICDVIMETFRVPWTHCTNQARDFSTGLEQTVEAREPSVKSVRDVTATTDDNQTWTYVNLLLNWLQHGPSWSCCLAPLKIWWTPSCTQKETRVYSVGLSGNPVSHLWWMKLSGRCLSPTKTRDSQRNWRKTPASSYQVCGWVCVWLHSTVLLFLSCFSLCVCLSYYSFNCVYGCPWGRNKSNLTA